MAVGLAALVQCSFAQAWSDAYGRALDSVRAQKWPEARASFKEAASLRAEDQSNPTRLPGPITEQRFWRQGSPYSPNFGAAYAGFKQAMALSEDASRSALLREVAGEFETLLAKKQASAETYFFLSNAYANLRDVAKQQELEAKFKAAGELSWKVDAEIVTAEDKALIAQLAGGSSTNTTNAGNGSVVAPAPKLQDKYAILIGNGEGRLENLRIPFGANDAMMMREKLVQFAGYDEKNVEVLTNASSEEIRRVASALAERVTNEATVLIFFTGAGVNLDGKDFLAGVDTAIATDSSTMVPKSELYSMFSRKGCAIYAFFQVNRPSIAGRFFGSEVPMTGSIAQTQATIPGGTINAVVRNGQTVGLFTDAMGGVLGELRSNRIPIVEFGWRVFDYMRGSRTIGTSGSGTVQTLTLPQLINLDPRTSGF